MKNQVTVFKKVVRFMIVLNSSIILMHILGFFWLIHGLLSFIHTGQKVTTYLEGQTTVTFEGTRLDGLRSVVGSSCKMHDFLIKLWSGNLWFFVLYLMILTIGFVMVLRRCRGGRAGSGIDCEVDNEREI